MIANKKVHTIHELKYFEKFEKPKPDIFHKIYFELTKSYLEGKKVLNIGCWTGSYEIIFKDGDCQITSIDLNFKALETASKANPHCKFIAANALELPFKNESFDRAMLFTVLEHLPKNSEEKVFKEINRILKEDGFLIITTPNNNFIGNLLDVAHWLVGHRHYRIKDLEKMLNGCGFRVEKTLLKGRFWSNFSIIFFYLFKYLFKVNIYMNSFVAKVLKKEYSKDGYRDIFMVCRKVEKKGK